YTSPGPSEILIRNSAVAINPLDWAKVLMGDMMFGWLKYPIVLGSDVAGEVIEVGKNVNAAQFQVGDRVVGNAVGMDKRSNKSAEGGFQKYTVLRTNLACRIPEHVSYERAAVIPLGFSTAACGLFMKDQLALQFPSVPSRPTGQTLVIWGGSTSVGCNAIQIAKAAGYEVITTSSPKNFEYVKKLGASYVFDYRSPSTVKEIIGVLKNKTCAGALAIGFGSTEACLAIVAASKGKKFVAQASAPLDLWNFPSGVFALVGTMLGTVWSVLALAIRARVHGVGVKFIFGTDLMANEVGSTVWNDFLPKALANGEFVPAPEPHVVGKGLEHLQEAMDLSKKGVSAKKVVVTL
ncbi:Dehydrogenase azaJ, partial [Lachnellula suecica]